MEGKPRIPVIGRNAVDSGSFRRAGAMEDASNCPQYFARGDRGGADCL